MLKRLFILAVLSATVAAAPARADHPREATVQDLQELQYDLDNLDQTLQNLNTSDSRYQDLQQRVDWLRQDVERLEAQIRAHRRDSSAGLGANVDQVQKLRDDVRSLQRDIGKTSERGVAGDVTLPPGTELQVQLEEPLSSQTSRNEDRVRATVARPVVEDGRLVIPAGTRVEGTVARVEQAGGPTRAGKLDVDFERLVLDDGRAVPLQSRIVSVGEGTRFDRKRAGIGAAIGGVLGSVIGGKKGAVAGIVVGAAGGGLSANAGRNVELPAGTQLTLRLDRPLAMADWSAR
jgi:hypothetical protein